MIFIHMFIMKLPNKLAQRMKSVAIYTHQQRNGWKHQCCNCVIYIHTNQFDYETSLCYLQVNYYETIKSLYWTNKIEKAYWLYVIILALCMGTNSCLWFLKKLKWLFFLLIIIFFRISSNAFCGMHCKWYFWQRIW